MKNLLVLFACASAMLVPATAREESLRLPKDLIPMEKIEEVKTKAAAEKKPITFLVTSDGSTDQWMIRTTEGFIDAAKKKTVITYVNVLDAQSKKQGLPETALAALKAMKQPKAPVVIVTDAEVKEVLITVASNQFAEGSGQAEADKAVDHFEKELRKLKQPAK